MNARTLLDNFDLIADAPGGVPKLRELILQLAVRGKLVPQEEGKSHREALKEREGGNVAEVPATWHVVPLERLANVVRGVSYKKHDSADAAAPGLVPILRGHNIQDEINTNDLVFVPETCVKPEQYIRQGDILVAMSSGSKSLVGKAAQSTLDMTAAFGAFCGVVRFEDKTLADWARVFFRTPQYRRAVSSAGQGIGINNLGKGDILGLPFPLPPLPEQKRIVTKVDELMKRCDELETRQKDRAAHHKTLVASCLNSVADPKKPNPNFIIHNSSFNLLFSSPESIAELRKTILQLAVQGRLVKQDPRDEPAEMMLKKIQLEKTFLDKKGKLKADKKAWVGTSVNPPCVLPSTWCWVRLQDVFEISRGGSPRPAGDPRYFGGSIPWITVGEITKDANKYLISTASGLTEEGSKRSRVIHPGDLLLTNSGATLGVPKISRIKGCMNDGVAVLRLFHSVDLNDFAYLYLCTQTSMFRAVNQGMGQPNLNTPIIAGWFFPLPPLPEQKRIVAKVNELMALCDALEAKLTQSCAVADTLAAALVRAIGCGSQNGK